MCVPQPMDFIFSLRNLTAHTLHQTNANIERRREKHPSIQYLRCASITHIGRMELNSIPLHSTRYNIIAEKQRDLKQQIRNLPGGQRGGWQNGRIVNKSQSHTHTHTCSRNRSMRATWNDSNGGSSDLNEK